MHKDWVKYQVLNHSVPQNKATNSVTVQYQEVTANYLLSSAQLNWKNGTLREPIPTPNFCQSPQPVVL